MRFQVMGVRTQQITVEVEADSGAEALEKAQTEWHDPDVWDTDDNFLSAVELY